MMNRKDASVAQKSSLVVSLKIPVEKLLAAWKTLVPVDRWTPDDIPAQVHEGFFSRGRVELPLTKCSRQAGGRGAWKFVLLFSFVPGRGRGSKFPPGRRHKPLPAIGSDKVDFKQNGWQLSNRNSPRGQVTDFRNNWDNIDLGETGLSQQH